jgi:hypothetical protein
MTRGLHHELIIAVFNMQIPRGCDIGGKLIQVFSIIHHGTDSGTFLPYQ